MTEPTTPPTLTPFEVVVRREGQVVWRVCRALLGPSDAEDAWAETFLAALRAYPDLAPDSNVRGWLVTIAHRKSLDQIRAARRRPEPRADPLTGSHGRSEPPQTPRDSPSDQVLEHLDDEELRDRVAALPDKARLAVIYRYLSDLPYAQVAELLGVSQAAARRNAADGIAKLRRAEPPDRLGGPDRTTPTRPDRPGDQR